MVLPRDELNVKIRHVGMRDGNMVVKIETINQRGEKVLEGSAEVAQATTVYVFTGQGSQEPGMGMDLYNSSPAARAVWDGADAHLLAVYGFSIIEIVKDNPKEKTIHFGGIKGQAIRQRYMDMTYDAMDKDGNVKTLPLFADINVRTPQYTSSSSMVENVVVVLVPSCSWYQNHSLQARFYHQFQTYLQTNSSSQLYDSHVQTWQIQAQTQTYCVLKTSYFDPRFTFNRRTCKNKQSKFQ